MTGDDREGRIFLPERGGCGTLMAWIPQKELDMLRAQIIRLRTERDSAIAALKMATEVQKVTFEELSAKLKLLGNHEV